MEKALVRRRIGGGWCARGDGHGRDRARVPGVYTGRFPCSSRIYAPCAASTGGRGGHRGFWSGGRALQAPARPPWKTTCAGNAGRTCGYDEARERGTWGRSLSANMAGRGNGQATAKVGSLSLARTAQTWIARAFDSSGRAWPRHRKSHVLAPRSPRPRPARGRGQARRTPPWPPATPDERAAAACVTARGDGSRTTYHCRTCIVRVSLRGPSVFRGAGQ